MRWQHLTAMATIILIVLALMTTSGPAAPRVVANDMAVDAQSTFEMNIELSQTQRLMTVSLTNGAPFATGAYEILLTYCVGDSLLSTTTLHPFALDAFGNHTILVPIQFNASVTNFEMHVSAFHQAAGGGSVHVHTPWRYGSMYVDDFSDVAGISPVAYSQLVGIGGDDAADASGSSTLGMLALAEGSAPSFAFASQMTAADGSFLLSGPGNYMAAGPPLQFSLTSGPTGVFTAN